MSYRGPIHCIALALVLVLMACSSKSGPKGMSESTYTAMRKAVNALELASDSRDASPSVFDPKLQAASKGADEVYNEMGNQSSDGYAADQIRSCVDQLKLFRSTFTSRESASRPIEQQLQGLKGTEMKDATDVVARDGKDLDDCVRAAKAYL